MENIVPLFDKAAGLTGVELLDLARDKVASVPAGRTLQSLKPLLDSYLSFPERRRALQVVRDLPSFVDWTNRHKDSQSVLFCDAEADQPTLVSVIDYHIAGAADVNRTPTDDRLARWGEMRVAYPMAVDSRWTAWEEKDGEPMSQGDFAAFLEDHALDLYAPTDDRPLPEDVVEFMKRTGMGLGAPGEIMALSKGLQVNVDQKVADRVTLQTGERALKFEETHETKQGDSVVRVPGLIMLAIPVFEFSEDIYRIPVRVRYRVQAGSTFWILTRWRADETFDAAVRKVATDAKEQTLLPLFYGPQPDKVA